MDTKLQGRASPTCRASSISMSSVWRGHNNFKSFLCFFANYKSSPEVLQKPAYLQRVREGCSDCRCEPE